MKTSIHKVNTNSETFDLRGLTLTELRYVYEGLRMLETGSRNHRVRTLASTIYASLLKDRPDRYDTAVGTETIMRKNAATLKALEQLIPTAQDPFPIPPELKGAMFR